MKKQTDSDLDNRRRQVLEAASAVFFRYGYARATIGDVATEAGLHRPALYALFPNGKTELFEAVLMRTVDDAIGQYRKETAQKKTLRQKLLYCVDHWTMGGYHLTTTQPDARDAFNMAYPAVRTMYERLACFYAELLQDAVARSNTKLTALQFARLLIFSVRGIKEMAENADDMRQLIKQEVDLFLAALPADLAESPSK